MFPLNEQFLKLSLAGRGVFSASEWVSKGNGCGQTKDGRNSVGMLCCKCLMKERKRAQFRYAIF